MLDHIFASSFDFYLTTSNDLLCDVRCINCLRRCIYYDFNKYASKKLTQRLSQISSKFTNSFVNKLKSFDNDVNERKRSTMNERSS